VGRFEDCDAVPDAGGHGGAGTRPAVKNGWLPLSSEPGLWEINSIGVISHDGRQLLIVVLSSGHPPESDGIQVVQAVAKAAVAVSAVTSF
jgi:hypothetical protein